MDILKCVNILMEFSSLATEIKNLKEIEIKSSPPLPGLQACKMSLP